MNNLIAGVIIILVLFALTFFTHFRNQPPEEKP